MINWKIVSLDISNPAERKSSDFKKTYLGWKNIWDQEYRAIAPDFEFSSDQFTRQQHVLSLFGNGEYAASVFFRTLDFSQTIDRDDSFVNFWPNENLNSLEQRFPSALVCSSFTIAKPFRGLRFEDLKINDVLAGISIEYFYTTNSKLMIALTRNTRKVNESAKKSGWVSIGSLEYKNEPSDMFYVSKNEEVHRVDLIKNFFVAHWIENNRHLKSA